MFTAIASVPFLRKILDIEEVAEEHARTLKGLILRNKKIIEIFGGFFFGIVLSYTLIGFMLPAGLKQMLFSTQLKVLGQPVAGFLGQFVGGPLFGSILSNNLKVLVLVMVLSLLYGAGAVLIITWNASVLGVFINSFNKVREFIPFIPHTILEFVAFFLAAIAGGLVSVGFEKSEVGKKKFNRVLLDSAILFACAVVILIVASIVEVRLV